MTTLPPDPEEMNDPRSAWAASALHAFQRETGTDDQDALGDLLCDLMHWCDRNDADFENALRAARMHYEAETMPEDAYYLDQSSPDLPAALIKANGGAP